MILWVVVSKLRWFKKGSDTYGSNVDSGIHWMMYIDEQSISFTESWILSQRLQHLTTTGDSSDNRTLGKTHVPGDSK